MSENKNQCLYQTVPAASEMNRVPGFDPSHFLRMAVSEKTKEKVWKLDLRYMKVWFRMARPNGRMKLKMLHITDEKAICEAQVYLDRNDTEPFSNYVAQCVKESQTVDYIKEAQDTALAVALNDAGFGIQFVDMTGQEKEERYGSEVPVSKVQQAETQIPVSQSKPQPMSVIQRPVQPTIPKPAPIPQKVQTATQSVSQPQAVQRREQKITAQTSTVQPSVQEQKILPSQMQLPVQGQKNQPQAVLQQQGQILQAQIAEPKTQSQSVQQPVQKSEPKQVQQSQQKVLTDSDALQIKEEPTPKTEERLPVAPENTVPVKQVERNSNLKYTPDMTVEEILKHMTLEEAKKVVVDAGVCKGWTIEQVAERRPPSLKYYVYGGYKGNNYTLAAAKIMLDFIEAQKAG